MRLTIIPSDNLVIVDGRGLTIELSGYPQLDGVRVLQWDDALGQGQLEFVNLPGDDFKPNETITSIEPYQDILDAWQAAADAQDQATAKLTTFSNAPIMGDDIKDIIGR